MRDDAVTTFRNSGIVSPLRVSERVVIVAGTQPERLARIEALVDGVRGDLDEVKVSVAGVETRMRAVERAVYVLAGVLVAAGGGTALVSQLTGGQ